MITIAPGWTLDVDRGPDWLFVKLHPPEYDSTAFMDLAESIWHLAEQNMTYRIVLEMHEIQLLHSSLLGQLVLLSKRIHRHDGMLRLVGLSKQNQQVIKTCRLDTGLPCYDDRGCAVMGHRPNQPR